MKKKILVKQKKLKQLKASEVDLKVSSDKSKTLTNQSTLSLIKSETVEPKPESISDKPIDFDRAMAQASNTGAQKRGRGRPPGSKTQKLGDETLKTVVDASPSIVNLPPPEPVNLPVELTTGMLQAPFAIYAKRTGFEGFALEKETADGLNPAINEVIRKYFPAGMGEHAALFTLVGTLGFVAFSKYMAYQDFLSAQAKIAESKAVQK